MSEWLLSNTELLSWQLRNFTQILPSGNLTYFSPLLTSIPLVQQYRGRCYCGIGTRTRLEPLESNSCGNSTLLHTWESFRNEKHTQRAASWPCTQCCAHHQCYRDRQRMRKFLGTGATGISWPTPRPFTWLVLLESEAWKRAAETGFELSHEQGHIYN